MGNCYSLQKDHETALKNFQRAVQLNSRFAYAHTLCGHEYDTSLLLCSLYLSLIFNVKLLPQNNFCPPWIKSLLIHLLAILLLLLSRYVSLEDFENGIKSYQSALRADARHYNSWYGLGMIYLRQEKFEFSEHHFRMAFQINPRSSVIMSYLGTALHTLKVCHLIHRFLTLKSSSIFFFSFFPKSPRFYVSIV